MQLLNEVEFFFNEAKRLEEKYKGISVVSLYYSIEDNKLSIVLDENGGI